MYRWHVSVHGDGCVKHTVLARIGDETAGGGCAWHGIRDAATHLPVMVKLEVVHLSREVHQRPQRRRPRLVVNACIVEVNDAHVRRASKVRSVRRRRQRSAL